jgi:hypothetical protein
MGTDGELAGESPANEGVSEELEEALARVRGATEELPPLDELAALQEAMAGLAQMGAVLQSLRRTSREDAEAEEKPAEDHDS